jgi:hypothetical protein
VTSGWLNPLLDRADFFGRIERFVHAIRPAIRPATSKRRNDE